MITLNNRIVQFAIKGLFINLLIFLSFSASAQLSINVETAMLSSGTKSSRTLVDFVSSEQMSKYGGNLLKRVEETGYFTITKIDNAWYIVDPEGYLFYSTGICSVVKGGGFVLPDSLKKIGCNTMGSWSDETINSVSTNKIAYTPRWNMMLNYKNTSTRTKNLYDLGIIPVFDSEFSSYCMNLAATSIAPLKNDPYILGHFSDNELPLYDNSTYGNLLDRFLAITSKTDPNYIAADSWMKLRSGVGYSITAADRLEFHGYVAGTYYRIVSTAIKKYDPNHLYIGSRLHGGAKSIAPIFREAGKYVDIISINVYGIWTPASTDMDMWVNESGKPFLVTEFYAKAEDTGLTNVDGAGWLVKTQRDRALFFENFTLALLSHRGSVGYHHFKYIDNTTVNTGLVNTSFKWYTTLKLSFSKISNNVYSLRNFMMYGFTGDGLATIYTGTTYQQKARLLKQGKYTKNDLLTIGIDAVTIASIKVKPNCEVTFYSSDNYAGDSVKVTSNLSDFVAINFYNKVASLKIVDKTLTDITDLTNNKLDVNCYPNPFSNSLNIDFPDYNGAIQISFYTISGSLVKRTVTDSHTNIIDTKPLDPGIYLIRFEGKNINLTQKIVKTL